MPAKKLVVNQVFDYFAPNFKLPKAKDGKEFRMVLAIAGVIPQMYGVWAGIDLYRSGRQAFKKVLFIKNTASGDFTDFLTGKMQVQVQSRSALKMGGYFVVAGFQVVKLSRQKNRLTQAVDQLRRDWVFYHLATVTEADLRQTRGPLDFIFVRRVKLLAKNALNCASEGFSTLKLMMELWDFCMGSDQERDYLAFKVFQEVAMQMMQQIDSLRFDGQSIQEQLAFLAEMGKKMNRTSFYGGNNQSFISALDPLKGAEPHPIAAFIGKLFTSKKKYVPLGIGRKLIPENLAPDRWGKAPKPIETKGTTMDGMLFLG